MLAIFVNLALSFVVQNSIVCAVL